MSYNKGFTLVELLIVIAIIGILSSVAVISLQSSKDKASKAVILNTLSLAQRAATVCLQDKQELNCNGFNCSGRTAYPPVAGQAICKGSSDVWPSFDDPDVEWYVADSDINTSQQFCIEIAWNYYDILYVDGGNYSQQYHCTQSGCNQNYIAGSFCANSPSSCGNAGSICTLSSDCCGGLNCQGGVCTEVIPN